jgi:hypothetical protein
VRILKLTLPLLFLLAGCHGGPTVSANAKPTPQQLDSARQQLDLIPPPSKNRYMAVSSIASWQNPYLTVYPDMITLHILLPDANPSPLGVGGITRPVGARRRDLSISPSQLPAALAAIPADSWPYGRVIAMEEAHNTPSRDRPQTRRTMETAMQQLTTLGIVMYDWNDTGTHAYTE